MNLLRYYFCVGGEKFDAEAFSLVAKKNGFFGGMTRITKNTKKLRNARDASCVENQIYSGISGTNGLGFASWQSRLENYVIEPSVYTNNQNLGMTTKAAQVWLKEEEAILEFLMFVKERLPLVRNFCQGDFFLMLKLVYGYDETDSPGGGQHYSETLMKSLYELNAGLSIDSESTELHFSRLQI